MANEKSDRVVLNVEDIRVDASPDVIATMMSALIHIPSYRKSFEQDPVGHLQECGISVPSQIGEQITPESIRLTLNDLTEGGEEQTVAAIPGVAVAVRVGTSPGTRPGVSVGVRVATGSSTFAIAQPELTREGGLAGRQKGQELKRQKRAQPDTEE
ncbi:MAG TPA: hypothetical protein VHN15_05900 [Thermoanaerobaculia bacterium]|nr:hypothetical protein [Thermoanaerobaculia bacterium]